MRLIDTVSRMAGCATQFDTSQLGEVTNALSHVTTTLCSQPPSTIPQPASTPALFPDTTATNPRDTNPKRPNPSLYEPTPTC
ncbi:hypothetical protein K443DRAFT_636388 [Laccaria amethystina LaAM-08-1]|uniref:Uncharacterized protein n=1 Tax=Laccaria amethystina LaAM-08-1 TaxID=1095629 RepID=A0A0C9XXQ6_9AGAR|nr:hypothetical protein K443DRAFT_636388 [Laccaria amethystina LaAM-08-1]